MGINSAFKGLSLQVRRLSVSKLKLLGTFWSCQNLILWTVFGCLKSCVGGYHLSHTRTLIKIFWTCVVVRTSYGTGDNVTSLVTNDEKALRILTFGLIRKQWNFKLSVREVKGGINILKTKRRLLCLKAQFVPRSKHFSTR